MFELLVPDALKIEAKVIHGDTWLLDYMESFCEEKWTKGLQTKEYIVTNIKEMLSDYGSLEVDEENRTITMKIQGPQKLIFNMLVGEFIGASTLGEINIKDLMGLAAYRALPYLTIPGAKGK